MATAAGGGETGITPLDESPTNSGIWLELVAGDPTLDVELQRTIGGNPFVTIAVLGASAFGQTGKTIFFDPLPVDNTKFLYRARHVKTGWTPGPYFGPIFAIAFAPNNTLFVTDPNSGGSTGGTDGTTAIDVTLYGAKGDALFFNSADITSGSNQVTTSPEGAFTVYRGRDEGKLIEILGAGVAGGTLASIITEVLNPSSCSIADNAFTTVTDAPYQFGTDNLEVIQGVMDLASSSFGDLRRKVRIPGGKYLIDTRADTASLKIHSGITIEGDGKFTELIAFGPNSGPIMINSGALGGFGRAERDFTVKDILLNADEQFHDGPTVGLCLDGVTDFKLDGLYFYSGSVGLEISNSIDGTLNVLRSQASTCDDIAITGSQRIVLTDVVTIGSPGFSVNLKDTQEISMTNVALDPFGSGALGEFGLSTNNSYVNFQDARLKTNDFNIVGTSVFATFVDQLGEYFIDTVPFKSRGQAHAFQTVSGSRTWLQFPLFVNNSITGSDLTTSGSNPGMALVMDYVKGDAPGKLGSDDQFFALMSVGSAGTGSNRLTPNKNFGWTAFYTCSLVSGFQQWSGSAFEFKQGAVTMTDLAVSGSMTVIGSVTASEYSGTHEPMSTTMNFYNGESIETVDTTIFSDGTTISASIERQDGGDVRFFFTGSLVGFDTTPARMVQLTAGTDESPMQNFVFITGSGGTLQLTANINDWPTGPHAAVATVVVGSAARVQTDGAYKLHAWTNHLDYENENGHQSHVNRKLRLSADWDDGVAAATSGSATAAETYISTTAGRVFQLHDLAVRAMDMSIGDHIYVVNDPTTAFDRITGLSELTQDASGVSLSNNKYYNFVLWASVGQDDDNTQFYLNLPDGNYTNEASAISDDAATAIFTIPGAFRGTGFLIARLTLQFSITSEPWDETFITDLRGLAPSTAPGGGASITSHAGLSGLLADDHPQYLLTSGTRQLAGNWNAGAAITSSFTGTFDGGFDGKIASGSRIYHELVDDGIQSSSFTMSWNDTNFRKITIGASIGIDFSDLLSGQISVLEIDNVGDHTVTLPGSGTLLSWNRGITGSIGNGTTVMTLTELSSETLAQIIGSEVA